MNFFCSRRALEQLVEYGVYDDIGVVTLDRNEVDKVRFTFGSGFDDLDDRIDLQPVTVTVVEQQHAKGWYVVEHNGYDVTGSRFASGGEASGIFAGICLVEGIWRYAKIHTIHIYDDEKVPANTVPIHHIQSESLHPVDRFLLDLTGLL
jgi:hypothetical protein